MKKLFQALFAFFLLVFCFDAAWAQSTNFGFTPTGVTQSLSVTSTSSSITLGTTPGNTVFIQNTGSKTAYIKGGATATTSDLPLQAGWGISLNYQYGQVISAITGGSDTTTLTISKGLGNFAMTGGGSGGGGSGGGGSINFPETNANSTISVTNTFQSALAASSARKGCWIQNQGTHVMFVYALETNSPTLANSTQFSPGQQYICNGVGAVQITGTAGDAYQVVSQ